VVTEGKLEMGIGDEVKTLQPGDMYIIPGGVEHYARTGDAPAKALDVFSPVRAEFMY
jgi:quercetin dioxygenase-like cupin family protein